MIHPRASVPQDQPTDITMTALYRQLDDHELGDDASFNVHAGLLQLADRIHHEVTSPAPAVLTSAVTRPRLFLSRLRDAGARCGRPLRHCMSALGCLRRHSLAAAAVAVAVAAAAVIAVCEVVSISAYSSPQLGSVMGRPVPPGKRSTPTRSPNGRCNSGPGSLR